MTTKVQTLAEFVLERIAEDEAIGRILQASSLGEDREIRLLAQCAAHRRIVELHVGNHECPSEDDNCGWWTPGEDDGLDSVRPECPTLRALASPYADAPGFREEWR